MEIPLQERVLYRPVFDYGDSFAVTYTQTIVESAILGPTVGIHEHVNC